MKNKKNQSGKGVPVQPLAISTTLYEYQFLKELVEKLAYKSYDQEFKASWVTPGMHVMETSSIEAYVSGDFVLSDNRTPFVTCFFFTCIKKPGAKYDMSWSSSLS